MDAPLAAPNAFIHSDCQQDAEPQPLPQELRDDIRRALAIYRRLGGFHGHPQAGGAGLIKVPPSLRQHHVGEC